MIYLILLKKDFQNFVGFIFVVKVGCSVGFFIFVVFFLEDVGKGFVGMGEVFYIREFIFFRNDCMGKLNVLSKQFFVLVWCL